MIHNTIKHLPKVHRLTLLGVCALLVIILLSPTDDAKASKLANAVVLEPGVAYELPMPAFHNASSSDAQAFEPDDYITHKVARGDTLAKILSKHGQSARVTYNITQAGDDAKRLRKIKTGDNLYLQINEAGQLTSLQYPLNNTQTLVIKQSDEGFLSKIDTKQVETSLAFAQGTIDSSFWNAGIEAGLTDNKIMQLAGIFGWDIDFAQEIREGDSFNMAYEAHYVDGEFVGYGDIVAAEFINQGDVFTAIQYTDGNYYTPDGRSMRKSFLRAPVSFTHVSSNFNPRRFHPVQKRIKPHRGVDYVAPVGTPVMAAGDGKVVRAAYDRFNGHHVFIQHGERYQTKYLHFKSRAVKVGEWVKQGQVIGYLGSTGMVTGAHLHYEFLVNGVHRNPRTVELPEARPIDKAEKDKFMLIADQQVALLNNNKRIMLAMN
ncbi:peptidoglycan DD-metalloendopeptidase family protein [Glaciecola sp. XM2]|jgi:murein DD-endopeptidase MepM/ murein hydrolase activator NlpD|uniref:peptidoglycan DD-metalloendopeptidase family protein n=1 Tax=Glaciecola sp. XM2 TaxID=1914931 RepID=UPI001BDEEE29|nr:peptidoglycan DD-metalloendopeptidase family protein [Glaciecola sp. XM2]MBT1452508.1 peptidoglycan DD-metalloendopeptidase family protein [Glaciecola sp. XM2]